MADLLQKLARLMRPHEEKQSRVAPAIAFHTLGRPVWTPRDYAALADEGFQRNAVAYRCVRAIAEAAASVPWLLYEGPRELAEHPLLTLLERPNAAQAGPDLFESWFGFLQVAGNAYLEQVAVDGRPRELYVLRPDRMKVVPGASGWPAAYEYSVNGRVTTIPCDAGAGESPVLHMRLFHPLDDHYGLSPLEAAATAIDIHNAAGGWNKALLDNAARPSGALVYKGGEAGANLSEDQFERLKRELADNYTGQANAGRPLLLEGGLDWKPMGLTPKDMDFIGAKTPRRATSRSPSACSPMLSAFRATTPMRITGKPTAPSGGRQCCRCWGARPGADALAEPSHYRRRPPAPLVRRRRHRGAVERGARRCGRVGGAGFLSDEENARRWAMAASAGLHHLHVIEDDDQRDDAPKIMKTKLMPSAAHCMGDVEQHHADGGAEARMGRDAVALYREE